MEPRSAWSRGRELLTRDVARADAFRRLAERHLDASYGLARAILHDPVEAQDAVQDAFIGAWRNSGSISRSPDGRFALVRIDSGASSPPKFGVTHGDGSDLQAIAAPIAGATWSPGSTLLLGIGDVAAGDVLPTQLWIIDPTGVARAIPIPAPGLLGSAWQPLGETRR